MSIDGVFGSTGSNFLASLSCGRSPSLVAFANPYQTTRVQSLLSVACRCFNLRSAFARIALVFAELRPCMSQDNSRGHPIELKADRKTWSLRNALVFCPGRLFS